MMEKMLGGRIVFQLIQITVEKIFEEKGEY